MLLTLTLAMVAFGCTANLNSVRAETESNITVNYFAWRYESLLFKYAMNYGSIWPDGSYVYLVVNMTITNNGYDSFNTDPADFFVATGNTNYTFDKSGTYDIAAMGDSLWKTVDIPNGGTFTGTLVFQIPFNSSIRDTSIGYSGYYNQSQSFNIIWAPPSQVLKPTPMATPSSTPIPTYDSSAPTSTIPESTTTLDTPRNTPHLDPIYYLIPAGVIAVIVAVSFLLFRKHRKTQTL